MSLHPKATNIFIWSIAVYLVCFIFSALSVYLASSYIYMSFNPADFTLENRSYQAISALILSLLSTFVVYGIADHPFVEAMLK